VITLYGIKNCDTVKKARQWLDQNNINYRFHDFRVDGLELQQAQLWVQQLGWETVVNRRSTSWKQLDSSARETMNTTSAIAAIVANPTLVKRPLLDIDGRFNTGFKAADYQLLF
jgi:Spx/MgsR family transcriptional regulator